LLHAAVITEGLQMLCELLRSQKPAFSVDSGRLMLSCAALTALSIAISG
jgi:hypothetical protein